MSSSDAHGQVWRTTYLQPVLLVLVFNLISAALFIGFVNRPVYDDDFNIYDVHNYATKGFSLDTVVSQRNAPGPASFAWMAAAVRLIGGNELRDARVGALFSWVLLGATVLLGARFARFPELWYAALLTLLVFPHTVEAAATVLTEGPALFFAVVGALAWTEFVSRADFSARTFLLGMLGCLSIGLAVTCRQYNLALLPAAGLLAVLQLARKAWGPGDKQRWALRALCALSLSAVPVALLVLAWKGISSPGIQSGTSYNMMYRAGAGLNFIRPITAALYVGLYLVPVTFPLMLRIKPALRWRALGVAALGGIAAGWFGELLLQPGPLNSVVSAAGRFPYGAKAVLALIVVVTIYNSIALGLTLWEQRKLILSTPPAAFALLTVIFFLLEQFGVGGNIPFYDRYILQVAPFFGVIAFALLPILDNARLCALAGLSILSHIMVWRYAFMG
jgi:Dolichyl-phosphate-mannose-protein mannosyltransferase